MKNKKSSNSGLNREVVIRQRFVMTGRGSEKKKKKSGL